MGMECNWKRGLLATALTMVSFGTACGGGSEATRAVVRLALGPGVTPADVARVEATVEGNAADPMGRAVWPGTPDSVERRTERPAADGWPLKLVVEPRDGDASRWFRAEFRVFANETDTEPSWTLRLLGAFEKGRTTEYELRIEADCTNVACPGPDETCREGSCVSAWRVPGVMAPDGGTADGGDGGTGCMPADCDDGDPCTDDVCGDDGVCAHTVVAGAACEMTGGGSGVCADDGSCVQCRTDADCPEDRYCDTAGGTCTRDCVTSVAAGTHHSCAVTEDGTVFCWGRNDNGQLGLGMTTSHDTPQPITTGLPPVEQVTVGEQFSCAVSRGTPQRVYCWGRNAEGQLGVGPPDTDRMSPQRLDTWLNADGSIAATPGIVLTLDAGDQHACAVAMEGANLKTYCWGHHGEGELGVGTLMGGLVSRLPRDIGLGGTAKRALGGHTSCAVADNLYCWGDNSSGQIGQDPTTWPQANTPRYVNHMAGSVTAVTVGGAHACLLNGSGAIHCWGGNEDAQLGRGFDSPREPSPTPISSSDTFSAVSAGGRHTCAIRDDGELLCWGDGDWTASGSTTAPDVTTPTVVPGFTKGIVAVSAGGQHTCAVDAAGRLYCWGKTSYGRLGLGPLPADVVAEPTRVEADFCGSDG